MPKRAGWQKPGEKFAGRHVSFPEYNDPANVTVPPAQLPFIPGVMLSGSSSESLEMGVEAREELEGKKGEEGMDQSEAPAEERSETPDFPVAVQQDQAADTTGQSLKEDSPRSDLPPKPQESTNWCDIMDEEEREAKLEERRKKLEEKKASTSSPRVVKIVELPPFPDKQSWFGPGVVLETSGQIQLSLDPLRRPRTESEIQALRELTLSEEKKNEDELLASDDQMEVDMESEVSAGSQAQQELEAYMLKSKAEEEKKKAESRLMETASGGPDRIQMVQPSVRSRLGLRTIPIVSDPTGPGAWDLGDWDLPNDQPPFHFAPPPSRASREASSGRQVSKRRRKMENPRRQLTRDDVYSRGYQTPERSCTPPGPSNLSCRNPRRDGPEEVRERSRSRPYHLEERRERSRDRPNQERREGPTARPNSGRRETRPIPVRTRGLIFGGLHRVEFDRTVDPAPYRCFNCWKDGHPAFRCPQERKSLHCYNCGRRGVDMSVCPRCKDAFKIYTRQRQEAGCSSAERQNADTPRDSNRETEAKLREIEEARRRLTAERREFYAEKEEQLRQGIRNRQEARKRENERKEDAVIPERRDTQAGQENQKVMSSSRNEEGVNELVRVTREILVELRRVPDQTCDVVLRKIFGDPKPRQD